ncbi:uncharacterized protein LOC118192268 [Stegodyphus dumicola]|uniref:uncharacterized protein LOC118192268 n=1 Tax=Stegodyphus dumicola TaxID=202533 RepID=UPI0015AEB610|nr:uncharacterized protein LOC118192268 [Stegodyphus dumicola]
MKVFCDICYELFDEYSNVAAITCGHVFHQDCISDWFVYAQSCPKCRSFVEQNNTRKLFFSISPNEEMSKEQIENEIGNLNATVKMMTMDIANMKNFDKVTKLTLQDIKLGIKQLESSIDHLRLQQRKELEHVQKCIKLLLNYFHIIIRYLVHDTKDYALNEKRLNSETANPKETHEEYKKITEPGITLKNSKDFLMNKKFKVFNETHDVKCKISEYRDNEHICNSSITKKETDAERKELGYHLNNTSVQHFDSLKTSKGRLLHVATIGCNSNSFDLSDLQEPAQPEMEQPFMRDRYFSSSGQPDLCLKSETTHSQFNEIFLTEESNSRPEMIHTQSNQDFVSEGSSDEFDTFE